ncbi:hypothetical protein CVD28_14535 [Bacillus sp. M6-12]|uniref:type II secretion system protein n=1 Tax=Bacillus sp. M6-12 TaxID=2054166 RepID=UPI000C75B446|nr:type II secretion system protein [Bacillus sp. M6-12]PLS16870.1 hypothetical protein CVD28_14535 [Bacillus sp. M6-12]
MKQVNFFQDNEGMTLIEVLLAVTILGILSISIMGIFNQAYDFTKKNEDKTVGINVARNILYFMEQQDYSAINEGVVEAQNTRPLTADDCTRTYRDKDDNNKEKPVFTGNCSGVLNTTVNDIPYRAEIEVQKHSTLSKYLIPISVTVRWNENEATVEGAIRK